MQFVGRFEMVPDVALNELCKTMDISGVSRERIEVEFEKLFLKSKRPSLGIRWLHSIGRLHEVLPEVAALVGVPQEPDWHPEGDVFEHTMQAVDAAAETECDAAKKLIIIYAALCHDLGKATTTKLIDGRLRSFGHADVGTELARTMLHRITHNVALIDSVCLLVKYHLLPGEFIASDASRAAYKRLARKLAPDLNLQMLADVARADKRGRNPYGPEPLMAPVEDIDKFLERAQEAQVKDHSEEPALQGRDLIDQIQPGPAMGELLKKAYETQIEEGIQDKEVLKKRVLENLS
ncbi:MAG: HD domain-containing protein [Candidatus Dependentiae bacterium]|nr:HD domain-containing protein [Candidatus Dependentiae bacterium]